MLGVNRLIALAVVGRIWARDVGREWDVADAIESGEEIVTALKAALKDRLKADAALAEFRAGKNLGLQFVTLAEKEVFADGDLTAGADQAFPIVGLRGKLAGQQHLDAAVEEIAGGGIVRTDWLSASACAATVEPRGENTGVVEDQQIAGPQKVRELAKHAVGIMSTGTVQVEHAGAVAGGEGFLGDEVAGKVKVEVGKQHDVRL
jgi:hypothetical protein